MSCNWQAGKNLSEGEKLAKENCSVCHAYPDPSLLDKETWAGNVLPLMGNFMKVKIYEEPYSSNNLDGDVKTNHIPNQEYFSSDKWEKIVQWYLTKAPEKPLRRFRELSGVIENLPHFISHPIRKVVSHPITTFVKFDSVRQEILFADGLESKIYSISTDYQVKSIFETPLGVAALDRRKDGYYALSMGILRPSDNLKGQLSKLVEGMPPEIILDSLRRPVHASYGDLNNDSFEDIVVSEFGFRLGELKWFEYRSAYNDYIPHTIKASPGAMYSQILDFDRNGIPDIAVLMAQGDEGIYFFYNEGNGKFRESRILQFPPSYGTNFFEMLDLNNDGYLDIITNNGDNGDYSVILKSYHGIRIYLNDGQNHFTEKTFLPVHGVQKTLARDFDMDGDIDLGSISYFPDFIGHPEESFIYWENTGDFIFKRFTFKDAADGRWMTMDANDIDRDGDTDLVLGSAIFSLGDVPQDLRDRWEKKSISVMILENTIIKQTR